MAKRVNTGRTYMLQRERNTSAGKKGTFLGKWSPSPVSAQARYAKKAAHEAMKNYKETLEWLGGKDK